MSEQTAQEPTMEEILASIRRIISEDDAPAAAASATPTPVSEPEPSPAMMDETPSVQAEEEVLELTQRYEEPAPAPAPTPGAETIGDIEAAPRWEEPTPPPPVEPAFVAPTPSFQSATAPSLGGGATIEELVRSILEPKIREWADQNLESIMRDIVREKLDRVFR